MRIDGHPVPLGARAFDLLLVLIRHADRVVAKEQLLDEAWHGLVVEEGNIAVQVAALRKVLGPDAIATVPGCGYQFAAQLEHVVEPGTTAPADPWPLYGRDADLETVCALLDQHALVSIIGAPGIGKTRLAQAVAHRLRHRYRDDLWMVELAAVTEPTLVASSLARAFGIPTLERAGPSSVAAAMTGRLGLLVIDNCEQVVDAVVEVTRTLQTCAPSLKILTTGQAPLRAPSEHLLRLSALAVPEPADAVHALSYAAVELFCARAQAADPRFELTSANHDAVIEVCRRLDGIPLAIELAASRVHLLGVEGVRARLGDRFRLLTTGGAHALPKQQTLQAALEWSHGLLSAEEQVVFRRLGSFAGRFTLEAAQHLAADKEIDGWSVLDHVGALVDRSLVVADGEASPRYRMLETTRLFAIDRLCAAGEMATIRRRHALATLAVIEQVDQRAWTMTGPAIAQHLVPEVDNLRAALAWACGEDGDRAIGVALVAKSGWLWESTNLIGEGIGHTAAMERWVVDPLPLTLQAAYWRARVFHHWGFGVGVDALAMAQRALELSRKANDPSALFDALNRSAIAAARAGQTQTARERVEEAQQLEQSAWPARQRAVGRFARGEWLEAEDRLAAAHGAHEERIALLKQAGERGVELHAQSQLVVLELALGDTHAAITRGRRVLTELSPQFPPFRSRALMVALAQALVAEGLTDEATRLAARALPLMKGSTAQWQALDMLSQLWAKVGDTTRAAQLLACADAMHRLHGFARKPHAVRARNALLEHFADVLPDVVIRRALAEGGDMDEDEAVAQALGFAAPSANG